jgi:hypothetical protein
MLDQLLFGSFLPHETAETRASTIETFLSSNGWTWDGVLDAIVMEDTILA